MLEQSYEKISRAWRFKDTSFHEYKNWFAEQGKPHFEAFSSFIEKLPQAHRIDKADATAWIWSFHHDPEMAALPETERTKYLIGACSSLKKISAFNAAIITQELLGFQPTGVMTSAESIRRDMLLKNLYTSIKPGAESRLRALAQEEMEKAAIKDTLHTFTGIEGFSRAGILDGMEGKQISAFGKRYGFAYAMMGERQLWFPCLFRMGGDTADQGLWELSAASLAVKNELVAGKFITLNTDTFEIATETVKRDVILYHAEMVKESINRFMQEYVLADTPIVRVKQEDAVPLDETMQTEWAEKTQELAEINLLQKKLEEREKALKEEILDGLSSFAHANNSDISQLEIPKGIVTLAKSRKIIDSELTDLLEILPEARDRVYSKRKPDPELMEKILIENNIDQSLWSKPVPDVNEVELLCNKFGYNKPIKTSISIRVGGNSKIAKAEAETINQKIDNILPEILSSKRNKQRIK